MTAASLTPIPQQIYDLVRRRPRSPAELIAAIWWAHPQDAPAPSAIKAHIWHANQVLRQRGERIVGSWGGAYDGHRDSRYRLVKSPIVGLDTKA